MKLSKLIAVFFLASTKVWAGPMILDLTNTHSLVIVKSTPSTQNQVLPKNEPVRSNLTTIIQDSAQRNNLRPELVTAVIHNESGFVKSALSPKGAIGLMQVMPGTAAKYGNYNLYDPKDNITVGTKHLAYLMNKYKYLPHALAAYNAGEGNVDKYNGVPPFAETQAYVVKVLKSYNRGLDQSIASMPSAFKLNPSVTKTLNTSESLSKETAPQSKIPKVILLSL